MSDPSTIAWLAAWQSRFSDALRTPLERASGSLRAHMASYGEALCDELLPGPVLSPAQRFAVYNRQYWFRLFTTLQREYPLTARLVGMWTFNELAAGYLSAHPPAHYDLQRIAPGFVDFLTTALAGREAFARVPSAALREAAQLDRAFSTVFLAPAEAPLAAQRLAAADFPQLRLRQAESVAFVRERWPLLKLRRGMLREPSTDTLALPAALADAQHWLVMRRGQGHFTAKLEPLAYQLYTGLARRPVAEALGALEASCAPHERAGLPARVQAWLADSVRAGFWAESR